MWNFTCLISVFTIINPINDIKPILNCIITYPLVVLSSAMLLIRYKA